MGVYADIRAAAYNRRDIAIHEAGHIVAARHFEMDAFGKIWPVENSQANEWAGIALAPGVEKLPHYARRMIGLAGAAAVVIMRRFPVDKQFAMVKIRLSPADWKMIGMVSGQRSNQDVIREALNDTFAILARERRALIAMSRQIIVDSRCCCRA